MNISDEIHSLDFYLDKELHCSCGRTHYAPLKYVNIGSGAIKKLPELVLSMGFKSVYIICDPITYGIAGRLCEESLNAAGIKNSAHQLKHLKFDEATLGEMLINMPRDCDLFVAVGTGTISDITRYFSSRMSIPSFTVATAATMDGFAASIGVMNISNMKTTLPAKATTAIFGDTDILKNAPYWMIAAGLGDLLGKTTCLRDWELSHIINDEHICTHIVKLMDDNLKTVLESADGLQKRSPEVVENVMRGLVMSGVAMSLYGNSRPASGCEHHMSHYWETIFAQRAMPAVAHGTQVSVGTVLILRAVEVFLKRDIDFSSAREAAKAYDKAVWEETMNRVYGPAAAEIIALENKSGKNDPEGRLRRIDAIEARLNEILDVLRQLPSSNYIIKILKSLDSAYLPSHINVDKQLLKDTFMYCREVRERYTFLSMLSDLNMLDSVSDEVIANIEQAAI